MAIYKLPLDDDLDADIIDWIAGFPRNKKSEVVRHALRYYINMSNEQEQAFIPVIKNITQTPVSNVQAVQAEEPQQVFASLPPRKPKKVLGKSHELLDDKAGSDDGVPSVRLEDLR